MREISKRGRMQEEYWEPPVIQGLGSISHLSDHSTRRRKHPLGFVRHETKAKPKSRRTAAKRKRA